MKYWIFIHTRKVIMAMDGINIAFKKNIIITICRSGFLKN
jgi:hypothetical protein